MILALLLALSQPAPSIDCETVRQKVAEYGEARAIAWALRNGFSFRQIREARKCLVKS